MRRLHLLSLPMGKSEARMPVFSLPAWLSPIT